MFSQGSYGAVPVPAHRANPVNGGLGEGPPGSTMTYNHLDVLSRQLWSCTNNSAPSEARKRGSGGGSPRKYDDILTRSPGCAVQSRQLWSCTNNSAPSEARKRGSGGGSPRKYDDLLSGPSDLDGLGVPQERRVNRQRIVTSEPSLVYGTTLRFRANPFA
jgi:hypothetical protein